MMQFEMCLKPLTKDLNFAFSVTALLACPISVISECKIIYLFNKVLMAFVGLYSSIFRTILCSVILHIVFHIALQKYSTSHCIKRMII